MTNELDTKKDAATKSLAIIGFIAMIILIVWLAVQIVGLIPSAFSSLASLLDSRHGSDADTFAVAADQNQINDGDDLTINWTALRSKGSYSFSYNCTEGISVSWRGANGFYNPLHCDEVIDLSDFSETKLDIRVLSQQTTQFADLNYAVTFTPDDEQQPVVIRHGTVTVVSDRPPVFVEETEEETTEVAAETENTEETTVTTPAPTTPRYVTRVTYTTPVSDPNGKTDLEVSLLGVGIITNNTFVKTAEIKSGQRGAFQFQIKNIGTKTSGNWSYTANLPTGETWQSQSQAPLKPNERAVITLSFGSVSGSGIKSFSVQASAPGDINTGNNRLSWAVTLAD